MVRVPSDEPVVVQVAAFPEPDHAPELAAQVTYEVLRDGDVWAGVDLEVAITRDGSDRQGSVQSSPALGYVEVHRGPRASCTWPSHSTWFQQTFPQYASRDDQHTG